MLLVAAILGGKSENQTVNLVEQLQQLYLNHLIFKKMLPLPRQTPIGQISFNHNAVKILDTELLFYYNQNREITLCFDRIEATLGSNDNREEIPLYNLGESKRSPSKLELSVFQRQKAMKYEEWIKYEEIRQNQPDKFAWIACPDLNTGTQSETEEHPSPHAQENQVKNNLMLLFQRFISRRI
jgi:hypothetical protein